MARCARAYIREPVYNETAKHSYPDWRNVIGPTKNGTETPGPHYGSRNEFSLRIAQSVLVGLRGFEPPHLNQRCHDSRILFLSFLFLNHRAHKPAISENQKKNLNIETYRLRGTKRDSLDERENSKPQCHFHLHGFLDFRFL